MSWTKKEIYNFRESYARSIECIEQARRMLLDGANHLKNTFPNVGESIGTGGESIGTGAEIAQIRAHALNLKAVIDFLRDRIRTIE